VSTTRVPASRATAIVAAVALLAAVVALVQLRASSAAADEAAAEQAAADLEVASDLRSVRERLAVPAMDARATTASLRVLVADAVTGAAVAEEPTLDPLETITDRTTSLRETAVRLSHAADRSLPLRSAAVSSPTIEAVLQRVDPVAAQAKTTAEHLHNAAQEADELAAAALALHTAAQVFVASTGDLPDSDDPDVVAAAWTDERDRLDAYLDAIEAAEELPALQALAAVHRDVAEPLADFADAAAAALGDGDLDAYNGQLADGFTSFDVEAVREALVAATTQALPTAVDQLEQAENRALGLVNELERLRRATPTTVGDTA
jgi:hypothetical protein